MVTDISWLALGSLKLITNYQTCTRPILSCMLQIMEMRELHFQLLLSLGGYTAGSAPEMHSKPHPQITAAMNLHRRGIITGSWWCLLYVKCEGAGPIPGSPEEQGMTGSISIGNDSLGTPKAAVQRKHFPSQRVSGCAPEHLNCTFPSLPGQMFLPWKSSGIPVNRAPSQLHCSH